MAFSTERRCSVCIVLCCVVGGDRMGFKRKKHLSHHEGVWTSPLTGYNGSFQGARKFLAGKECISFKRGGSPLSDCWMWGKRLLTLSFFYSKFLKKIFIYLFLDKAEGREKVRERNSNVWLPLTCPQPGTWPKTQICALTGNRTGDFGLYTGAQSTKPH